MGSDVYHQVAVRAQDVRRLMWTLTSIAVRIAQAMGLHLERPSHAFRPFEREMRRRLWWQIYSLDSQAAQDRATNPIIHADSFTIHLPLNINDEDLDVNGNGEVEERQGFTNMTFCLVCHEITGTVAQLNYKAVRSLDQCRSSPPRAWSQRINAVIGLQRRIDEKYLYHLDLAHPFH